MTEKLNEENAQNRKTYYGIIGVLLKLTVREGYLDRAENVRCLPEMMKRLPLEVATVYRSTDEYLTKKYGNGPSHVKTLLEISFQWCCYAGMGAALMWDSEAERFMKEGVVKVLCEPRGFRLMDEYVLDETGLIYKSPEGQKFAEHVRNLSRALFFKIMQLRSKEEMEIYIHESMMAMFILGETIQLYRMEKDK